MRSEFYSNGYDAGYNGDDLDSHGYAPGTAAYNDWHAGYEDGALDSWQEYDAAEQEADYPEDDEPAMSLQFEHDSAMTSIGWGTDEDYGYFGGDEDY